MDSAALDDVIQRLLEVRTRPGKQVQLSEAEIRQLCAVARDIFMQQPNLLEIEAPIKICGENVSNFLMSLLLIWNGCDLFLVHRCTMYAWFGFA